MSTAKKFLQRAFWLEKSIESKKELLKRVNEQAESVTVTISFSPKSYTGRHSDIVGENASKSIDLEREVLNDYNRLLTVQKEIYAVIQKVGDDKYRLVLERRYILCEKWDFIASDNNYSLQNVFKLHNKALAAVERIIGGKKSAPSRPKSHNRRGSKINPDQQVILC